MYTNLVFKGYLAFAEHLLFSTLSSIHTCRLWSPFLDFIVVCLAAAQESEFEKQISMHLIFVMYPMMFLLIFRISSVFLYFCIFYFLNFPDFYLLTFFNIHCLAIDYHHPLLVSICRVIVY